MAYIDTLGFDMTSSLSALPAMNNCSDFKTDLFLEESMSQLSLAPSGGPVVPLSCVQPLNASPCLPFNVALLQPIHSNAIQPVTSTFPPPSNTRFPQSLKFSQILNSTFSVPSTQQILNSYESPTVPSTLQTLFPAALQNVTNHPAKHILDVNGLRSVRRPKPKHAFRTGSIPTCQDTRGAGCRSSFHLGYFVPPVIEQGDQYGGLEVVWAQHFFLLFSQLPGVWSLSPTTDPLPGHIMFRDMAKVRFSCQRCFKGWTSMFGVALFYITWQPLQRRGSVFFKLMGQACNKCRSPDVFETPMWYPEEAHKVLTNLFLTVCSTVYGLAMPPINMERRHGRPRHQHDSSQCQGCAQGLCKPKSKPR